MEILIARKDKLTGVGGERRGPSSDVSNEDMERRRMGDASKGYDMKECRVGKTIFLQSGKEEDYIRPR